ncbi:MAG: hypothetical protein MUF37_05335 [Methanoregulaceae archaeon]|nr:hypothetical protein [Methanoregulaceae archaeon]
MPGDQFLFLHRQPFHNTRLRQYRMAKQSPTQSGNAGSIEACLFTAWAISYSTSSTMK